MTPFPPTVAIAGRMPDTANYENALKRLGVSYVTTLNREAAGCASHLLLPGGGDITPAFFGQTNKGSHSIDTTLDILQLQILISFLKQKKPVLGICKGLQLINVHFGGDIIQNIDTADTHRWVGHDQMHHVYHNGFDKEDFFYQLYGSSALTNSAHHQAAGRLGNALHTVCRAGDGIIEGIAHDALPVMAVQWHPERMPGERGDGLLSYFLSLEPL